MTALPERPHLFTIQEYVRLGETAEGTELVEGRLIVSPRPKRRHNRISYLLATQLENQLPSELETVQDVDIDLELAPADKPGFSRCPDLLVSTKAAGERVDTEGGLYRASELLLVVEIVSAGSRYTDSVTKRAEYAKAGIPHYWIIDTTPPVSMIVCHQAGPFGYQDPGEVTGKYRITEPFAAVIDLEQLDELA